MIVVDYVYISSVLLHEPTISQNWSEIKHEMQAHVFWLQYLIWYRLKINELLQPLVKESLRRAVLIKLILGGVGIHGL